MAVVPGTEHIKRTDGGMGIYLPDDLVPLLVPIDELITNELNPRTPQDIDHLAALFREFGFTDPVVVGVESCVIEAGHMRRLALLSLGATHAPRVRVAHETLQALRYNLAHNRSNERTAKWDDDLLGRLMRQLQREDAVEGLGWEGDDLAALLEEQLPMFAAGEAETPEPPAKPLSVLGMLWVVGPHRLVVGDSCDPAVVALATDSKPVDLVFTDPPYGVAYKGQGKATKRTIANDDLDPERLVRFLCDAFGAIPLKAGGSIYVCHPDAHQWLFQRAFTSCFHFSAPLVWVKNRAALGREDYQWRHEGILYGWKKGAAHFAVKDRRETTVWEVPLDVAKGYKHPTQKPVALPRRAIKNSSRQGQRVYDGFSGSGSTAVAAIELKRVFAGVELEPDYADVIVRRMVAASGLEAVGFVDGREVARMAGGLAVGEEARPHRGDGLLRLVDAPEPDDEPGPTAAEHGGAVVGDDPLVVVDEPAVLQGVAHRMQAGVAVEVWEQDVLGRGPPGELEQLEPPPALADRRGDQRVVEADAAADRLVERRDGQVETDGAAIEDLDEGHRLRGAERLRPSLLAEAHDLVPPVAILPRQRRAASSSTLPSLADRRAWQLVGLDDDAERRRHPVEPPEYSGLAVVDRRVGSTRARGRAEGVAGRMLLIAGVALEHGYLAVHPWRL